MSLAITLPSLNALNIFLGRAKHFPSWHHLCFFLISFLAGFKTHTCLSSLQRSYSSLWPPVYLHVGQELADLSCLHEMSTSLQQHPLSFYYIFLNAFHAHSGLSLEYLENKATIFSEEIVVFCQLAKLMLMSFF